MTYLKSTQNLFIPENAVKMEERAAIETLFDEVSHTFWIFLIFYIIISLAWILYNIYNHQMEENLVEKKIEQNGVMRTLELQRLLEAYNRVTSNPSPPSSSDRILEQV